MIGRLLTKNARSRHRTIARYGDTGTSLIELLVAMIIMTIAGSIFTGAIVTLYKTANQAQATTTSAQQNNQAYQSLDRRVRYASAISAPGQSAGVGTTGDWYVELRNTTDGIERCTQLRLDIGTGTLQRRTWVVTSTGSVTSLTDFLALGSGLTNGSAAPTSADRPFVLQTPNGSVQHQVVTFTLISQAGTASQTASSRSSFDLTALNSIASPTGPICQQVPRK